MKRHTLILCALAICAARYAAAQPVEVFGGYALGELRPGNYSSKTMNGWNTAVAGYPASRLGIAVDLAGFYSTVRGAEGSAPAVTVRQYSFLAGPQFRLIRGRRFETSLRALFGGARWHTPEAGGTAGSPALADGALDQTTFAALFGSDFDWNISRGVALRFSPGIYLTHYGDGASQRSFRFSIGPVFRIGGGD